MAEDGFTVVAHPSGSLSQRLGMVDGLVQLLLEQVVRGEGIFGCAIKIHKLLVAIE
jgi:hypothetical protein